MKTEVLSLLFLIPFIGFSQINLLFDSPNSGGLNPGQGKPENCIVFGSELYFTTGYSSTDSRIYKTDGTTPGTELVVNSNPTAENYVSLNPSWSIFDDGTGDLFLAFTGDEELGGGIFRENRLVIGSMTGSFGLNSDATSVIQGELENINDRLYFIVAGESISRLNLSGTVVNIKNFGISVTKLFAFNGELYMTADDGGDEGNELYVYFPNINQTFLVADINQVLTGDFANPNQTFGSNPDDYIEANGKLYFTADNGFGRKLCVYNGTTVSVIINTDQAEGMEVLTDGGNTYLIGSANVSGTKRLVRVNTSNDTATLLSSGFSNPEGMTAFNGFVYFSADGTSGKELYRTDGTTGNTGLVLDINTAPAGDGAPQNFLEYSNSLYFRANNGINGEELWRVSTSNNVSLVEDYNSGIANFSPKPLAVFNDKLYLSGIKSGTPEIELYTYQDPTLSVLENENLEVKLFPNPVENFFSFQGINKEELLKVSLFDIYGKMVKDYKMPDRNFSVNELPAGVYFIKAKTKSYSLSKKMIKK